MKDLNKIYADFLSSAVSIKKGVRIVVDVSNGIAGEILKKIGKQGLEIVFINDRPDGDFPAHGPNPMTMGAAGNTMAAVVKEKADFGTVLDGDGDRAIFYDNTGRKIHTDVMMRLLLPRLKPKKIILDPRNGQLIRKYAAVNDIETVKSKVGRYFIQKEMNGERADLAVEISGHYHFAFKIKNGIYRFDSAARAIVETVNVVSRLPYALSDFIDLLPRYYRSGEINFRIDNKEPAIKRIENYFRSRAERISRIDGLSMDFKKGDEEWWFNIRPSANDPVLRLNVEASTKPILEKTVHDIKKIILPLR